jgi:hypothetical protein
LTIVSEPMMRITEDGMCEPTASGVPLLPAAHAAEPITIIPNPIARAMARIAEAIANVFTGGEIL